MDQLITNLGLSIQSTNFEDNKNWQATESLAKQGLCAGFQDFTSDASAIARGDLASTDQGTLILVNLSNANTLLYGSSLEFELPPNDWHKVRVTSGTTFNCQTVTGSVKVQKYWAAE